MYTDWVYLDMFLPELNYQVAMDFGADTGYLFAVLIIPQFSISFIYSLFTLMLYCSLILKDTYRINLLPAEEAVQGNLCTFTRVNQDGTTTIMPFPGAYVFGDMILRDAPNAYDNTAIDDLIDLQNVKETVSALPIERASAVAVVDLSTDHPPPVPPLVRDSSLSTAQNSSAGKTFRNLLDVLIAGGSITEEQLSMLWAAGHELTASQAAIILADKLSKIDTNSLSNPSQTLLSESEEDKEAFGKCVDGILLGSEINRDQVMIIARMARSLSSKTLRDIMQEKLLIHWQRREELIKVWIYYY